MNARDGFRNGIEMMQQSARMMGVFLPGRGLFCDWQELDRKIEAFRLFQYADRELGIDPSIPLDKAVRQGMALEPFRSIWVLEGVGHMYATAASLDVRGLMNEGPGKYLLESTFVPMHAGIGMALAEKLLAGLTQNPTMPAVRDVTERFLELCRNNCRPGWEDATMEPLGLVVRCLYPSLLGSVSAAMDSFSPDLRRLFWHGVGRSLYFVPTNFLPIPYANERMVKSALGEVATADDQRNVVAGLIWAVTLVNLPDPAVIRALLTVCSDLNLRDEFTNGVFSAVLAWRHMAPGDLRHISAYTRAAVTRDKAAALWNSAVETPVRTALANIYPGLVARNNIAALYSYRTMEEMGPLSAAAAGSAA